MQVTIQTACSLLAGAKSSLRDGPGTGHESALNDPGVRPDPGCR